MEVEISIRLNRISLTRLDPTIRLFPGNHVTRPEFSTLLSQLPPPATAHITSPSFTTCPDWGYTYWHRQQLTLVSPIPNQGHVASPTESTPTRPLGLVGQLQNLSPAADRRSDRTNRESLRRQQRDEDPGRVRLRSRHTQATRSVAAEPLATTRHDPDHHRRETVNVRGSTTSVFDRLGRPGTSRQWFRDHSIDKPVKEEKGNQNRLDHLQRQLDQLMGQQYGREQVGAVDPPFTPAIMASPYPASAARQWYRRLVPESINSFKQLADAFAAAFLGSKTIKMETSYVFGIKQDESEPLKEYLDRFDKAVVQIKSCSDNTLIQAFREGVKDRRLVWTLAYDVPPTFAHLRGIAWKHAEADEYVRGRGMAA
ncbi:hypothetical protein TIFTF001_044803 [Ficus carica]|uniref:Retrotransposon gag domain-containing protein n=1 Tax=Ficus carica TaxID=3494 RepID=A0AA87ZUH2_FICCA|nr:hypothetical protein TIFTF001_044803 [Ficus carica]